MKAFSLTSGSGVSAPTTLYKLSLLLVMYLSQRVFLCFSWTLLPMLLRQEGASLGTIGFSALVYSPWALKFTYASWLDRTKGGRWGRRKSWIVPLLIVSGAAMPVLALFSPQANLAAVLTVVALLNLAFATIDIAVDGYATDILEPGERPWGNTIQTTGYVLGYLLGAGVFLVAYQHLGWAITLLLITALQVVLMVPILLHREIPATAECGVHGPAQGKAAAKPRVWPFIKQRHVAWFFLFAGLLMVIDQGGLQLRLPMLVDLGVDPAGLGSLNIWVGSPLCIVGAAVGGTLLSRMGKRSVCALCCLGAAALSLFSAFLFQGLPHQTWAIAAMVGAEKLFAGMVTTFIFSIIMTLSVGPQSATNYAVLASLVQLVQFAVMPAAGMICDLIGYFDLYFALAFLGFLALFTEDYILRNRLIFARNYNG